MNRRMIVYIMGQIIKAEALFLAFPTLMALLYTDPCLQALATATVVALVLGLSCSWKKPANTVIYAKEGFVVVALSWVVLSIIGALPFYLSREIPSFVDALFETISGFTTTGASILTDVESMSPSLLLWRSFTHWVGGMGVLVFVMMVLPLADNRSMHLMRAEVPGPTVGKVLPKIKDSAKILYGIYIVMTIVEIILLMLGGMPAFDAAIHAFGTAGTGGFSNRALSVGAYQSPYIEWVITIFMALFGVNFNMFFYVLIKNIRPVLKNEELRAYVLVMLTATALIAINILPLYSGAGEAIRTAAFQVSSVMTTTGFATTDFNLWPEFSKTMLVILMFFGACSGSTGGGIKFARLLLYWRNAKRGIRSMLHPRSVSSVQLEGKPVAVETMQNANVYLVVYTLIAGATVLILSLDGFGFETNFTAMAACLNNIGPGLGAVGPMGNFEGYSILSKLVLSANMLLGRLEIFPLLLAVAPSVWRGK